MLYAGISHIGSCQLLLVIPPEVWLLDTDCCQCFVGLGCAGGRGFLACFPQPCQSPERSSPMHHLRLVPQILVGERGYRFQVQPQVSPIYKEPPVLKISPLRAQETEYGVGQVSPCVCHWPGLQEPSFPTWGVVITPPHAPRLVHCVAKDSTPLGTLPQHPQRPGGALDDPCLSDATDGLPARLFLGGVCSRFAILLASASCLPFLQMPWVRALCPSRRHCGSGDIPGFAESTRNYGHQAALLARENAAPLSPPALPLLGGGTQATQPAHGRQETLQMQWRPVRLPVTAVFHVQRGSSPASLWQRSFVLVCDSRLLSGLCWRATHWGALIILGFNACGKGWQDTALGKYHVKIFELDAPPHSPGLG